MHYLIIPSHKQSALQAINANKSNINLASAAMMSSCFSQKQIVKR